MWKSLFKKRRSRNKNLGVSKGVSPLVSKQVVRTSAIPLEAMRLKNDAFSRKLKTQKLNTLGRLEASAITRRVLGYHGLKLNKNHHIPEKSALLKPDSYKKDGKMYFRKDSEICRSRKEKRDEIMKKTAGKGLKVKNALWNYASFIQCK